MTNITTVSIPKELANKLKERIKGSGFHTLSSYITYVCRQIVLHSNTKDKDAVKQRLQKLDYLD
ncbi:MAG TPA: CopG family transcriptional regulator [Candidatus Nanoarchaeia archaeon]|nr:CopG family transcriptional regulator [Candidatus Nanoarchaeia archaeon]